MTIDVGRPARARRRFSAAIMTSVMVAALCAFLPSSASATSTASTDLSLPQTVVSMTFDDGNDDQFAAAKALEKHGMRGTFFVNSGFTDQPGYMTRAQLTEIERDGHEIGGHTVSHADLATQEPEEIRRQICDDRARLIGWGHDVRNFAYPFASLTPEMYEIVESCGYGSARALGDVKTRWGCPECAPAETIPPGNLWQTRALSQVDDKWTLDDLKDAVVNAEPGGGWVQFTFHHVCDEACADPTITATLFDEFLEWLEPRAASGNTVVRTVEDVLGSERRPAQRAPRKPVAPVGVNAVRNSTLAVPEGEVLPWCFMEGGWGDNSAEITTTRRKSTGESAIKVVMKDHVDGDAKAVQQFDLGQCAPSVDPGERYELVSDYTSTTNTQFAVYVRLASGTWHYWMSSPWFPASESISRARWRTPPIPAGVESVSFGLSLFSDGKLLVDDVGMYSTRPKVVPFATWARQPGQTMSALVDPRSPVRIGWPKREKPAAAQG